MTPSSIWAIYQKRGKKAARGQLSGKLLARLFLRENLSIWRQAPPPETYFRTYTNGRRGSFIAPQLGACASFHVPHAALGSALAAIACQGGTRLYN